jgi:hypothetical protein
MLTAWFCGLLFKSSSRKCIDYRQLIKLEKMAALQELYFILKYLG